ncbi:hypothetical protein K5X82_10985 [Halosquirtibacter xylanolyticus]|uniref:tetratricopeptide repeat protein n=1 Tax=Halosquirtibacter xylanolyticus TaxID=3374599 RepID=UPI0037498E9D|nr:hypothetical protein K5X82_10985 [Prolixibacteraceae bacterium]
MIFSKKISYFLTTLVFILLLFSSCVSKRMYKKGLTLEKANMPIEAAEYYRISLIKNSKNVDARIALKRTGQLVLNDYLNTFYELYKKQENERAVDKYEQLVQYHKHLIGLGVRLNFDDKSKSYYEEVKDAFISESYQRGIKELDDENFAKAASILSKIYRLNPKYREVKEKRRVAIYEPIFRNGQQLLMEGAPRNAYYTFNKILKETGDYKDSKILKEEALEQATITMVVTPCTHVGAMGRDAGSIRPMVTDYIQRKKLPFFKVKLDPKEAFFHLDMSEYVKYVHGIGANTILKIRLLDVYYGESDLERTYKCAYTKTYEKYKDENGEEKKRAIYHKHYYREYRASSVFRYGYQYSLISTTTGEVLHTDSRKATMKDRIIFARYKGDYRHLIPGYFEDKNKDTDSDSVSDNDYAIKKLRVLFNQRDQLVPVQEMRKKAIQDISQRIANGVCEYNGDKQVVLEN